MRRKSNSTEKGSTPPGFLQRYGPWLALFLVILLFTTIRWRLREIPLERDEGEYAYAGQLLLQGIPPYQLAYNMKLPGTYAAYACLMAIFGQTAAGIHIGLLLINAVTSVLIFFLARRLFSIWAGVAAAAAYALLSASPSVVGWAAHANHFVVLVAVGGLLMLTAEVQSPRKLFWCGLLFGVAVLMKQHGVFFGLFAGLWLLASELRPRPVDWKRLSKNVTSFLGGCLTPFILVCLALWAAGVFEKFWYWTFTYAWSYAAAGNLQIGWERFPESLNDATTGVFALWVVAGLGLLLVWCSKQARFAAFFLSGLLLASFISVWPGFVFRPHYFVLMLPVLSLLGGAVVHFGLNFSPQRASLRPVRWVLPLIFVGAFGWALYSHTYVFFRVTPREHAALFYNDNPFIESESVARYIKQNSRPDDRIAIIGSEPQIYFLAKRRSVTGYIYTYAMMEGHPKALEMQREMIREIETSKPEYLVFVGFPFSWIQNPGSSRLIFEWFEQFTPQFYDQVGIVDYGIDSVWGPAASGYTPKSDNIIGVFRRRSEMHTEISEGAGAANAGVSAENVSASGK